MKGDQARNVKLKAVAKVLTTILYFIKFAIKSFVIDLKIEMLNVSDRHTGGRTYLRTQLIMETALERERVVER